MRNRANHYLASNILLSLSLSSISIVCSTKEEGDDSQNRFIYIYTHTHQGYSIESRLETAGKETGASSPSPGVGGAP